MLGKGPRKQEAVIHLSFKGVTAVIQFNTDSLQVIVVSGNIHIVMSMYSN